MVLTTCSTECLNQNLIRIFEIHFHSLLHICLPVFVVLHIFSNISLSLYYSNSLLHRLILGAKTSKLASYTLYLDHVI